MRKIHLIMVLFLAFLCIGVAGVEAYDLKVGDIVKYQDAGGTTTGGPFNVDVNPGSLFSTDFTTFCVESSEYMYWADRAEFTVGSIGTKSIASNKDLAEETAWLYAQYRANPTAYNVDDLQKAIWWFQGQAGGVNNTLAQLAHTNAVEGEYYGVRIANMLWGTNTLGYSVGSNAQDILVTPEPTMAIMLGGLLLGIGVLGRRQFLKR